MFALVTRWEAPRPDSLLLLLIFIQLVGCSKPDAAAIKADAVARGDRLVREGRHAEAVSAYATAVELAPLDGDLRLKLATEYQAAEQWMPAAAEMVRAADLMPGRFDVQLLAAQRLLGTGQFVDGADRIDEMRRSSPDDPSVLVLAGNAKARLYDSTRALFLMPKAESREAMEGIRLSLRPGVPADDDAAAEVLFRRALALAPDNQEAQFGLVNFLWATGRYAESEPLLKRLADAIPGHMAPNYSLGRWYLLTDRGAEAEPYLRNAAVIDALGAGLTLVDYLLSVDRPQDALNQLEKMSSADASGEISVRAAAIELAAGRPSMAVQRLDPLLQRLPNHAGALRLKAEALLTQGARSDALPFARAAVKQDPDGAEARATLGKALLAAGDPAAALVEYREAARLDPSAPGTSRELARVTLALGRDGEASEFAREAVRRDPTDADSQLILARALIRRRDFSGAERTINEVLARYPDRADALTQLGLLHVARGTAAPARTALTRVLQLDPEAFEARTALVALELKEGRIAAARQLVDPSVAAHPKDPRYLNLAATVARAGKDTDRAQALLRQALAVDRRNAEAALSLASLLSETGRREEAIGFLRDFSREMPTSDVRTALGGLLEDAGRSAEAQAIYESVVAADERATAASLRLTTLYLSHDRDIDKALDLVTIVRRRLPDDPAVNDLVGQVYLKKELPAQALPYVQTAVRSSPDNALYRFHLGQALRDIGQFGEARTHFARALELDPDFVNAPEARAALGRNRR